MNRKLILNLLSSSSIFVSLMSTLGAIYPAHAAAKQGLIHKNDQTCIASPHAVNKLVCIKDSQRKQQSPSTPTSSVTTGQAAKNIASVEFTEEESDRAIQLFGCDCPACISSLRNLQGTGNLTY
ncbi:hypothetical protein [Brasilonema octagenarum]|uniref:Uncharacterized protein n=1 Tax=Brasilonema octagenarum UFV-OR1 TaxID=417115 RepID=A0ABX1M5N5_9CYAN|nr:hypothetical protein [Brasilonema octagenarum]NMF62851.1 hypothetical protein [Brasilonema octagenarum UFV-OR1]